MLKPRFSIAPTQSTTTGGAPQLYDSGILYDSGRYYDRWYDSDGNLMQGERPLGNVTKWCVGMSSKDEKEGLLVKRRKTNKHG